MRNLYKTLIVTAILSIISVTSLLPAHAGAEGRKNTAIVLTAATVYGVLTKNDREALVAGLGSAQAWKNYEDARKRESKQKTYARNAGNYSRPATYGRSSTKRYTYKASQPRIKSTRSYAVSKSPVRKASTTSTSSSQIKQLQAQVAQLKASNAALENKIKLQALQAENASIKAELAEQKTLIAQAKSNMAASKMQMGFVSLLAVVSLSIAAFGVIPRLWKKENTK